MCACTYAQTGPPHSPPKEERCIGWNQLIAKSQRGDYPNSIVLRAWTTAPRQGVNYYLSFCGHNQPDGNAVNYIGQLTTDQTSSSTVILTRSDIYSNKGMCVLSD